MARRVVFVAYPGHHRPRPRRAARGARRGGGASDDALGELRPARRTPGPRPHRRTARRARRDEPAQLRRVFRAEAGRTPAAYVERTRVEVARRCRVTTALSVDDIARAAGFGTPEMLRRAFGRRAGASPSADRERFALLEEVS